MAFCVNDDTVLTARYSVNLDDLIAKNIMIDLVAQLRRKSKQWRSSLVLSRTAKP